MESELKKIGVTVDGNAVRFFEANRPQDAGDFPSLGARGCFMSHLGILKEAEKENLSSVLILEDDASLSKKLARLDTEAIDLIKNQPWDQIYFGHQEDLSAFSDKRWVRYEKPVVLAHCYSLSASAIQRYRQHLSTCLTRPVGDPQGSPMHVDGAFSVYRDQYPDFITYLANPSLAGQRSSRSDIAQGRWFDDITGLRHLIALLRKSKNYFGKKDTQ
jgi:glycosyl transferase family 25